MIRRGFELGSERGAAAVEFALVMPLLFLLLFGIFQFGRMYNTKVALTGAVREGARVMAIRNDPTCNASPVGARYITAQSAALNPAVGCGEVNISPSSCVPGANVTVWVERSFTVNIPGYIRTFPVRGTAVMRCGG